MYIYLINIFYILMLKVASRDFPGGPVVKTSCFQGSGADLIPGQGTKISQAA